jgi:glycosyltransferase involved in cell wall biosynthesis
MKIRIARIVTRMDMGGAQQAVLYLANHLNRDLFEQIVITGEGGLLSPDLDSASYVRRHIVSELTRHVGVAGLVTDLTAVVKIRRILENEKPDIAHTHTPKAGIVGRWASWLAGVPRIAHTFHGFGFGELHPMFKKQLYILTERLTGTITTQFVVVSENNRLKGLDYGFYCAQNCELIRSGVDFSSFQTGTPDKFKKKIELELQPSDKIVGIVAGFKPPKGLHDFLDVARRVRDQSPQTKFLMVGDGELRNELELQVRRLHLDSVVKMLGWRRDVPELMQIFDIFLLTSHWEGLPRVLLEAMSLGIPIVASDVDGISEVVQRGENGYLSPPGDTPEMARQVLQLLDDDQLRRSMGRRSQRMVEPFSAQRMLKDYTHLYLRMMNRSREVDPLLH